MKKFLGWGVFAVLCAVASGGFIAVYQQDVKDGVYRETLQSMTRVGEIKANNTTVSLWAFDFDGKRCLYATHGSYRGGLTCWDNTQ